MRICRLGDVGCDGELEFAPPRIGLCNDATCAPAVQTVIVFTSPASLYLHIYHSYSGVRETPAKLWIQNRTSSSTKIAPPG